MDAERLAKLAAMPHAELAQWALSVESIVPAYRAALNEIEALKAALRAAGREKAELQKDVMRLKVLLQLT